MFYEMPTSSTKCNRDKSLTLNKNSTDSEGEDWRFSYRFNERYANYGAAKMALAGLMQTLSIEGEKHNIRVNALAPTAATRMTEGLMPEQVLKALEPSAVVPAMLVMASEDAPNRTIICAGAGSFEVAHITLTQGVHLGTGPDTPERLAQALGQLHGTQGEIVPRSGSEQGALEVGKALKAHGA